MPIGRWYRADNSAGEMPTSDARRARAAAVWTAVRVGAASGSSVTSDAMPSAVWHRPPRVCLAQGLWTGAGAQGQCRSGAGRMPERWQRRRHDERTWRSSRNQAILVGYRTPPTCRPRLLHQPHDLGIPRRDRRKVEAIGTVIRPARSRTRFLLPFAPSLMLGTPAAVGARFRVLLWVAERSGASCHGVARNRMAGPPCGGPVRVSQHRRA